MSPFAGPRAWNLPNVPVHRVQRVERRSDTYKVTQGMSGREGDGPLLHDGQALVPSAKDHVLCQIAGDTRVTKTIRQDGHSPSEGFCPAQGTTPMSRQPLLKRCFLNCKEQDDRAPQDQSPGLTSSHSS